MDCKLVTEIKDLAENFPIPPIYCHKLDVFTLITRNTYMSTCRLTCNNKFARHEEFYCTCKCSTTSDWISSSCADPENFVRAVQGFDSYFCVFLSLVITFSRVERG